jgi:hypothetical protein
MTHEELLARVQFNQGYQMGLDGYKICSALRAVVELHKPHNEDSKYCAGCEVDDPWYWNEYPCPTIQAIESALQ